MSIDNYLQTSKAKKLGYFTHHEHGEKGEGENSGGEFEDESDSDEVAFWHFEKTFGLITLNIKRITLFVINTIRIMTKPNQTKKCLNLFMKLITISKLTMVT